MKKFHVTFAFLSSDVNFYQIFLLAIIFLSQWENRNWNFDIGQRRTGWVNNSDIGVTIGCIHGQNRLGSCRSA